MLEQLPEMLGPDISDVFGKQDRKQENDARIHLDLTAILHIKHTD